MNQSPVKTELDYSAAYYDPPHVKWWVLLIVTSVIATALTNSLSESLSSFFIGLGWHAWGIYLCVWLRRLNPKAISMYWILAATASQCLAEVLSLKSYPWISWTIVSLEVVAFTTSIIALFVIRRELVRHYSEREYFPMKLGPFMTFFFSFVYFQYHLYDIAEYKRNQRMSISQP